MSLTSGMFMPLRAMGSQYNQAKADGKVDLFIALAHEALWKADPPDISIRTDSYTVRAFEKVRLELYIRLRVHVALTPNIQAIQKKLEAISLVNQYAPCPQWEAIMWLSAGVGLSGSVVHVSLIPDCLTVFFIGKQLIAKILSRR